MSEQYKKLLEIADKAAENAYAPYSNFKVGACALFEDGSVYTGCNVENSSYGLSLCAERNAVSTAIAQGQKSALVAVAISCKNTKLCYPCGACRQWITEFNKSADVIVEGNNGEPIIFKATELLPNAFEL